MAAKSTNILYTHQCKRKDYTLIAAKSPKKRCSTMLTFACVSCVLYLLPSCAPSQAGAIAIDETKINSIGGRTTTIQSMQFFISVLVNNLFK